MEMQENPILVLRRDHLGRENEGLHAPDRDRLELHVQLLAHGGEQGLGGRPTFATSSFHSSIFFG